MLDYEQDPTWSWSEREDPATVALSGELDFAVSDELRDRFHAFVARTTGDVVLDLGGLLYLDSSGLAALIEARRLLQEQGRQIRISRVTDQVRKIFTLTQVGMLFGL